MTTVVASNLALTPAPTTGLRMALDAGSSGHVEAEELLGRLVTWVEHLTSAPSGEPTLASIHPVTGPLPSVVARMVVVATWQRVSGLDTTLAAALLGRAGRAWRRAAVVVQTPTIRCTSPGRDPGAAWIALAEHESRTAGRLARFAGLESLHGEMTAADVVARSAVERVEDHTGSPVAPERVLRLRGAVRPAWTERGCVLRVDLPAGEVPRDGSR